LEVWLLTLFLASGLLVNSLLIFYCTNGQLQLKNGFGKDFFAFIKAAVALEVKLWLKICPQSPFDI